MDYALEILKDELKEIHEMQQNLLEATDEITFEKRRGSLEEAIKKVDNNVDFADERKQYDALQGELILKVSPQFCEKCNPTTWGQQMVEIQPDVQECSECGHIQRFNVQRWQK